MGVAGMDVPGLQFPAADDWEKYEPVLGWPKGEEVDARLTHDSVPERL